MVPALHLSQWDQEPALQAAVLLRHVEQAAGTPALRAALRGPLGAGYVLRLLFVSLGENRIIVVFFIRYQVVDLVIMFVLFVLFLYVLPVSLCSA